MTRSRHLVLATAVGYGWTQVAPFIRSLRRTGYAGDILLLVGALAAADRRELLAHRVRLRRVQPLFRALPAVVRQKMASRKLRRFHAVLPWLQRHAPLPADWARLAAGWAGHHFQHIAVARFSHYYAFLRAHARDYERVMTTDVRDVLFQADPFSWPATAPLEFFLEHRDSLLGSEWFNANWVREAYGEKILAQLADRRISCSGITYGTTAGMLDYLAQMTDELVRTLPTFAGVFGDQGPHNYLLWTGAFPQSRILDNYAGPVFTGHNVPAAELHFAPSGHLLDPQGRIIPVLHQFDRLPGQAERLRALLN
jgi:hypothetical protein